MRERTLIGPAAGFLYSEIDRALVERLVEGMEAGVCSEPGAELLFDHDVRVGYRLGNRVVKHYRTGHSRDRFRASPAVRAADQYERLLPIRSPRPDCAFEVREGRRLLRSLLVCEYVEGPVLGEAWGKIPDAETTLGPFLAEMHERWIYHGVMKWDHLIWNHGEWVVIDTESLRHPLRKLRTRNLAERQWAALAMDLEPSDALERAFGSYLEARELSWDRRGTWNRILRRREEMLAGRQRR
jgi:tRNA A-37 threonylcarbamoyl transferase component Bud32